MSIDLDQLIRGAIESTTERRSKDRKPKVKGVKDAGPKQAPSALPQVSLLPAEVRGQGSVRRNRALLLAGVVGVSLLAGGALAGASATASDAQSRADSATGRLSAAAVQLGKFRDVQTLQQRIRLSEAADRVGSSTAIDWQRWHDLVLEDIPSGFAVTSFDADSATPFLDYPQGSSPIEQPRAATVTITATTSSIDGLPIWLRQLKGLPAFADLIPTTTSDGTTYTVQVVIHLTAAAYETPLKGTK